MEAGEAEDATTPESRLPLRALLPAPRAPKKRPATPTDLAASDEPPARRRQQISIACDACRTRKCKCDGAKPTCGRCRKRNLDCVFQEPPKDALKRRLDELQGSDSSAVDVYRALQFRPEREAVDIFRRIRAGVDPATIMRQISAADVLLQVQLQPETRFRYDFPYRPQMPAALQTPGNPYLQSLIHAWSHVSGPKALPAAGADESSSSPTIPLPENERLLAPYLMPYHTAAVIDPRIDAVVPSKWTSVSTDDDMLRTLLRAFFLHEYDFFKYFQKDYFLDDMVSGHGPLCSPLLVNCVLAVGSHSHSAISDRAEYWNPHTLGYKFLAEAKRLWEIEASSGATITTLQAALVMQLLTNVSGMDKVGNAYTRRVADMARDLDLFGDLSHIQDPRLRRAHEFTAWALFCWAGIIDFSFRAKPTYPSPPKSPFPDPVQDAIWHGEIWVKYHASDVLTPLQCGLLFQGLVGMTLIMHQLMLNLNWSRGATPGKGKASIIINALWELKSWYHGLPEPLSPRKIVLPAHLKLHLYYYDLLTWLYDMLVLELKAGRGPGSVHANDLKRALAETEAHFETILRLYYLRHGFEKGDSFVTHFLAHFAFSTLAKLEGLTMSSSESSQSPDPPDETPKTTTPLDLEEIRAALVLVEQGLSDQGRSFYFPQTIFHVVRSRLGPEESRIVLRHAGVPEETPEARRMRAMHVHSSYPVRSSDTDKPLAEFISKYAESEETPSESS